MHFLLRQRTAVSLFRRSTPLTTTNASGPPRIPSHAGAFSCLAFLGKSSLSNSKRSSLRPLTAPAGRRTHATLYASPSPPLPLPSEPSNRPGSEPGVDPSRDAQDYAHIVAQCHVDVVEYTRDQATFKSFDDNKEFVEGWLKQNGKRDGTVEGVRWINVKGIDWGVIKALSMVYGLHPLALEDVLHARDYRSKADYYKEQLFIKGLALLVANGEGLSPESKAEATMVESVDHAGARRLVLPSEPKAKADTPPKTSHRSKRHHYGEEGVRVKERNIYMFMFRDGTLLTFHEARDSVNDRAIMERLRDPHSGLRNTPEASVLLQSLLDLMVDHAIQVVDAFQNQILYLEQETLLKPHTDSLKLLHLLSADVTLHKRALTPLRTMVYGLRRYDMDRCIALAASAQGTADPDIAMVKGFMSHRSKIYLADVHDHLEYVISSLETFETITENLVSYSFNTLQYSTNETMRRLTLATIIFFPLTLLTSYFGMNFEDMPSVAASEWRFWQICVPYAGILVLLFKWRDIQRMVRSGTLGRRWKRGKAARSLGRRV